MALDPQLLEILACPDDKGPLLYFADEDTLYNPRLKRRYRILDGDIPALLIDPLSRAPIPARALQSRLGCRLSPSARRNGRRLTAAHVGGVSGAIHPNAAGHAFIATRLLAALR